MPVITIKPAKYTPKQNEGGALLSDPQKKFIQFYGSSRSGKTFLAIDYVFKRAMWYAGSFHLICRYSFANAKKTIWLQSIRPYAKKLEDAGVCKIKDAEGIITFYNGSTIILGGLEPARIDSILASEYATIFVTEANENAWPTIEKLMTRLNSQAVNEDGRQIIPKLLIDLNPPTVNHWTFQAWHKGQNPEGGALAGFERYAALQFKVEDNRPHLSPDYIETLKNLSTAQRKRFYEGEFGSFEGLVYQIDEAAHIVEPFDIPPEWDKGRAIDFGFTHPFVCLWTAYDKPNETIYVYREWVKSGLTVRQHANNIKELSGSERYAWTVADHDAGDRATLAENGVDTVPAKKNVLAGIDAVTDCLYHSAERRPRLKVFRDCVNTINGFYSYRWKTSGVSQKDREVVKEDDDEMDALRYAVMAWRGSSRKTHRVQLY